MHTFWSELVALGRQISDKALTDFRTLDAWKALRDARRQEFFEMVGLAVRPPKSDLAAQSFGTVKGPGYTIEKLAFQSLPHVHVTANLYVPAGLKGRAPAVLYPCGHALTGTDNYQIHGDVWARRGYVCLVFNTLEQGDSLGDHHGIYNEDHYDWISRGYQASGGELWNSLRALDLLLSRPEVDPARVGVTGNSGGGAHSWWIAIADERVRAAAPFCGTNTIASFIAERTINGHCDCMFYHNVFQRDLPDVAALIAPRPLLVGQARHDSLYHPSSYHELVEKLKRVYALYGAEDMIALCEYDGPHGYSPAGHEAVQRWFDRHVAGEERPVFQPDPPKFKEQELTVFGGAPPADDRTALMPELLSVPGRVRLAGTPAELARERERVVAELRRTTFRHFPADPPPLALSEVGDWRDARIHDFTTESGSRLRLWWHQSWKGGQGTLLAIMGPGDRAEVLAGKVRRFHHGTLCILEPRGTGPGSWHASQDWMMLRAALLTGRTPDSVRVWDILRALAALREVPNAKADRVVLFGEGFNAVLALYAALLDERVAGVLGDRPTGTHADGPHLLGVLRVLDVPQAAALLAPRPVGLAHPPRRFFHWTERQYARLGCADRFVTGDDVVNIAPKVLAVE